MGEGINMDNKPVGELLSKYTFTPKKSLSSNSSGKREKGLKGNFSEQIYQQNLPRNILPYYKTICLFFN